MNINEISYNIKDDLSETGKMIEQNMVKKCKLKVHSSNFSEDSLVINEKDFSGVKKDDIMKIWNCDGDPGNYLVVKVESSKKEGELQKDTISIEQTLANQFNFHAFQSVNVMRVEPNEISLDMLEVTFKDQYISRSDMWRLKRHLVGSCMYINEKVEFCDIRAQVSELWINDNEVKCGLVTDNTRIVLRSASALVYIFVQMSSEMWDFDAHGRLQIEKAINGFLKDLFTAWKEKCYHEFTLVLFSRTFYHASSIEDFPKEVHDVVQQDYRGLFYIDFYNCVAHHERNEDCTPLLYELKKLINSYKNLIQIPNCPPGYNSLAAEGNFLEAVNMSLNVFEKHYVDRNFDRTGQLVMCITPGAGIFDVDRDLTVLTKERMIDNGIGSDLICLGQQPLHAVPLFKFHSKDRMRKKENIHDFNIPHWINHSFYASNPFLDEGSTGIKYVPKVYFPTNQFRDLPRSLQSSSADDKLQQTELPSLHLRDYEDFDEKIFSLTRIPPRRTLARPIVRRTSSTEIKKHQYSSDEMSGLGRHTAPLHIPRSFDRSAIKNLFVGEASSVGPAGNLEKYLTDKDDMPTDLIVGSEHSSKSSIIQKNYTHRRALINPFVTSNNMGPLSSNRRKWVHTLPRSKQFEEIVQQTPMPIRPRIGKRISESSDQYEEDYNSDADSASGRAARIFVGSHPKNSFKATVGSMTGSEISNNSVEYGGFIDKPTILSRTNGRNFQRTVGVDWKSLRSPACLPITNDFFPSKLQLHSEYTEQPYNLIPDHDEDGFSSDQFGDTQLQSLPTSTQEIFLELVNQRLCQGFQLVVPGLRGPRKHYDSSTLFGGRISPSSGAGDVSFTSMESTSPVHTPMHTDSMSHLGHPERYTLNHGRQYHVVALNDKNEISVKIYKPRHPFQTSNIQYKYLLWAISRDKYRMAEVRFSHEQYEGYYWNYQDNCVCSGGADADFKIIESIKYWRSKFILIPSPSSKLPMQKSEMDSARKSEREARYDIFDTAEFDEEKCKKELAQISDGMIRFFDYINKVRRYSKMSNINPSSSLPSGKDTKVRNLQAKSSKHKISAHSPSTTPVSSSSTFKMHSSPPKPSGKFQVSSFHANPIPLHIDNKNQDVQPSSLPTENLCDQGEKSEILSVTSDLKKISQAMLDKNFRFPFLTPQRGLPNNCFISIEAVQWCLSNINGVDEISDAVTLFEKMRDCQLICHACGDSQHPFIYGYYLFYLIEENVNQPPDVSNPHGNSARQIWRNFEQYWLEVKINKGTSVKSDIVVDSSFQKQKPKSALSTLLEKSSRRKLNQNCITTLKNFLISLSNKHKTARTEWCQIQYQPSIIPWRDTAVFCFTIQWMVATATCLFEILQSWLRDASRCNLYLLPMPNNPFAFPHTEKDASPLHCPMFVQVNLQCLVDQVPSFQGMLKKGIECRCRIIQFMEKIAIRFGFCRYYTAFDPDAELSNISNSRQYVHYTGQVFLEIPITDDYQVQGRSLATKRYLNNTQNRASNKEFRPKSHLVSPRRLKKHGFDVKEEFVENVEKQKSQSTTYVTVEEDDIVIDLKSCGFYFAPNHMLTRRWRVMSLEDCSATGLETDFIKLCSNSENRLSNIYKILYD